MRESDVPIREFRLDPAGEARDSMFGRAIKSRRRTTSLFLVATELVALGAIARRLPLKVVYGWHSRLLPPTSAKALNRKNSVRTAVARAQPNVTQAYRPAAHNPDDAQILPALNVSQIFPNRENNQERLLESCGRLPLSFDSNLGQTDGQAKFVSREKDRLYAFALPAFSRRPMSAPSQPDQDPVKFT
jgi:hypothetical protein